MPDYLPYSPAVEQPAADEGETFAELGRVMHHITTTMADRYRHAYRPVHAKSHGIVKAVLAVKPGLPQELSQGLFARPGTYDALLRFSTNPGDMLSDKVSSPRGLAIKIMGVDGEQMGTVSSHNQDFLCVNGDVFSAPDAKGFLAGMQQFDKTLTVPPLIKETLSTGARAANAVLGVVGVHSPTLMGMGYPAIHPLGECFSTVTPLRYGAYVAKLSFTPASENLKKLTGESVDPADSYNALRDLIQEFFRTQEAVWEVQVQLATTDSCKFPIEKADVKWPVEDSPWQTVGTLTAPPQETYSVPRQVFTDERIGYNPWHGLVAHQPLGSVMRSRKYAYEEAQRYRAFRNERERVEPASAAEIPE